MAKPGELLDPWMKQLRSNAIAGDIPARIRLYRLQGYSTQRIAELIADHLPHEYSYRQRLGLVEDELAAARLCAEGT